MRQERWIPHQRTPDSGEYGIEPFPVRAQGVRPGEGRVLDHDEWSTGAHRRYEPQQPPSKKKTKTKQQRPDRRIAAAPQDDEEADEPTNYIGSFVSTACWYLVPIAAYTIWCLTLSSAPRAGCVNAFGLPCPAPRTEALSNLFDTGPQFAMSLALSILFAMLLGRVTSGWRPLAIGFASAVLGAGVATVLFAVLATQF